MSTVRVGGAFHIHIGSVKIAEVVFRPAASRWRCYLRLMRNDVSYQVLDFESMGQALQHLHALLRSPPPEGSTVGQRRARPD